MMDDDFGELNTDFLLVDIQLDSVSVGFIVVRMSAVTTKIERVVKSP